jgi:hypothetical protein
MLMRWMTAGTLAGGLVAASLASPALALPSVTPGAQDTSNIILVDRRGGGGGGGGVRMGGGGGGGGFAMRGPGGGGGGGFAMRGPGGGGGGGFAMRNSGGGGFKQFGGFKPSGFKQSGGFKQFQGGGAPRFVDRGFKGPGFNKGPKWSGQKWYGGNFKHRYGHKHHRKFRGFAFYGYPYFYGYSGYGSCDWLYRRAINTGSAYWWNRYYACRDGYYDY